MDEERYQRLWHSITARVEDSGSTRWVGAVCAAVVSLVDGVDAATLTVRANSWVQETWGASDEWAASLEELQYTLGEGPGLDAFKTGNFVLAPYLSAEHARWPGFVQAVGSLGLVAVVAFPLQVGAIRLGTLDLFCRTAGRMTPDALTDAAVLADLAVYALLRQLGDPPADDPPEPDPAPSSGDLPLSYHEVHVATGMLAAHLNVELDEAFTRLRARAYAEDRPLLALARDVVARRVPLDDVDSD
ncbi:ANTAR domain-containing protein [Actinopolymorpha sp. NPDC004070]|uniref:ANTAR domain-containing protein n=1 Tax=Actinopolymorpha sp. NPDC004070 TaxID=3154548 RepID=UPI0033BDD25B